MLSKKIKQYLPTAYDVRHKYKLGILGDWLFKPELWHLHRYAVARAVAIGLFIGSLPLPGHMIMVSILAVIWSANLPLSLTFIWVTNPITLIPISYFEYKIGAWILNRPEIHFQIEWTWAWFAREFTNIFIPMMLGGLLLGLILGLIAYFSVLFSWKIGIVYTLKQRKKRRK